MAPTDEKQTQFLQTVAKSLGRSKPLTSPPKRVEVGPPAFWKEMESEFKNPFELFKKNLEGLTGRVVLVKDGEEATRQVKDWLQEVNAKSVILWDHPELKQTIRLEDSGLKIDYWTPGRPDRELIETAEKADAGITWVSYAIGYSGTLALFGSETQGRSVSLLPPTHIAVFKRSNIAPTMSAVIRDLIKRQGAKNLPSSVDFITGPSRTSDIEMDLSIGVHGPYRVWTVVIDDTGGTERI